MSSLKVSRGLYGACGCLCLLLFALLPVLDGQQKSPQKELPTERTYTDKDAYEIYAILLQKHAWRYSAVVDSSISGTSFLVGGIRGDQQFDKLWHTVIDKKQSESPKLLTYQFPYGVYRLISSSEMQALFQSKKLDEGWHAFYERYPDSGGYYHFSAVGFNSSHNRAIVEMSHWCGPLCGEGDVYFFEKHEGNWSEVEVNAAVPHMIS